MQENLKSNIISKINELNDTDVLFEIDSLLQNHKKMTLEEYQLKVKNAEKDILENNLYSSEEIANLLL